MARRTKAPRFDKACATCGAMMSQVLVRASSCAECSRLKDEAYRRNVYAGLMAGFEAAQADGLVGAAARARALEGIDALRAERAAYRQAEEGRKRDEAAARVERARINAFLRRHGYTWHKVPVGTEDDWAGPGSYYGGVGELDHYAWELWSPDGRAVAVADALRAIETSGAA